MREYNNKAMQDGSEFDDEIIKLENSDTTETIREDYFFDDTCYWAKKIDNKIFYSRDEVFFTDRKDATHVVVFTK